jgi:hypothetical protein
MAFCPTIPFLAPGLPILFFLRTQINTDEHGFLFLISYLCQSVCIRVPLLVTNYTNPSAEPVLSLSKGSGQVFTNFFLFSC